MKGWQFDRAVDLLITQHVLEAGDEIAKILIKAVLHVGGHVRDNTTSNFHALLFYRLKGVFDITSYLINLYLLA